VNDREAKKLDKINLKLNPRTYFLIFSDGSGKEINVVLAKWFEPVRFSLLAYPLLALCTFPNQKFHFIGQKFKKKFFFILLKNFEKKTCTNLQKIFEQTIRKKFGLFTRIVFLIILLVILIVKPVRNLMCDFSLLIQAFQLIKS
jgi:hypothetical protein